MMRDTVFCRYRCSGLPYRLPITGYRRPYSPGLWAACVPLTAVSTVPGVPPEWRFVSPGLPAAGGGLGCLR